MSQMLQYIRNKFVGKSSSWRILTVLCQDCTALEKELSMSGFPTIVSLPFSNQLSFVLLQQSNDFE